MRSLVFIFISFVLLNFMAHGQSDTVRIQRLDSLKQANDMRIAAQPSYIIKSNLLPLLWGPIPLTSEIRIVYETSIAQKSSLQLTASYLTKSPFLTMLEATDSTLMNEPPLVVYGYRVGVAYKLYLHQALKGWYVAPVFNWSQAYFTTKFLRGQDVFLMARYVNYGLVAGYQLIDYGSMALDIYAGLGRRHNVMIEHSPGYTQTIEDFDLYLTKLPIKFYLGMNYGFTF